MVFSTKYTKNFLGREHSPLTRPFPQREGDTPGGGYPSPCQPPSRLRHFDPSHSKILGTPLLIARGVYPLESLEQGPSSSLSCLSPSAGICPPLFL